MKKSNSIWILFDFNKKSNDEELNTEFNNITNQKNKSSSINNTINCFLLEVSSLNSNKYLGTCIFYT